MGWVRGGGGGGGGGGVEKVVETVSHYGKGGTMV